MSNGRKYYCLCEANCKFETMTKEQILAAIAQAAETGLVFDTEAAFITKVKESNAGGFVTFWLGTQAQYNALVAQGKKDPQCFYILTDCDSPAELTQKVKDLQQKLSTLTAADVGARPDTWLPSINEIGAAPAGYGLGKYTNNMARVTEDTVNTASAAGWYEYYSDGVPLCDGYKGTHCGGLLVIPSMWGVTQFFFCRNYYGGYLKRNYVSNADDGDGGHWEPWEWVNPPLLAGAEYRTTERCLGKPVYAKVVSAHVSISTDGTTTQGIPHNTANWQTLVRYVATYAGAQLPGHIGRATVQIDSISSAKIFIKISNPHGSEEISFSGACRFTLHYIKK